MLWICGRLIKRTDGVSTTDILGRMLLMTKQHFQSEIGDNRELCNVCQTVNASHSIDRTDVVVNALLVTVACRCEH
jgi:hypothetical protein